jgi:NAD(P)-dependent dehydrogenase (short-subunit alcohol dehydrogenase family)
MATGYIPYRLDGKVALVTGSGRGIGAAMAIELGRLGAKVVVNYANAAEPAAKVVAEIKSLGTDAIAFKADVRQVSQIVKLMDDAVAHFGGLDIVCSNSGVVSFGHLGDVTEASLTPVRDLMGTTSLPSTGPLTMLTGRIRPRIQPQHTRTVLRGARGVPPSQRRRAHHPDVVQHGQGL